MTLPDALGGLAPEANLHSLVIGRRGRASDGADDASAHGEDNIFCAKGRASAEGFRPSYWHYDRHTETGEARQPAKARNTPARENRAFDWYDACPELKTIERKFLDFHTQVTMNELEAGLESGSGTPAEILFPSQEPDPCLAPEADLRSIALRRNGRDRFSLRAPGDADEDSVQTSALIAPSFGGEGLFARKGNASFEPRQAESTPDPSLPQPDVVVDPPAATQAVAVTAPSPTIVPAVTAMTPPPSLLLRAIAVAACIAALGSVWLLAHLARAPRLLPVVVTTPGHLAAAPAAAVAPAVKASPAPMTAAVAPASRIGTDLAKLVAEGDTRFKTGDVYAARLFYERAADAGSAHAALMVGATYDPSFLASVGVRGLRGNAAAAALWYHRASVLGDPAAARLLANLRGEKPK